MTRVLPPCSFVAATRVTVLEVRVRRLALRALGGLAQLDRQLLVGAAFRAVPELVVHAARLFLGRFLGGEELVVPAVVDHVHGRRRRRRGGGTRPGGA